MQNICCATGTTNFQACVSKGITLRLACQLKWEEETNQNMPPCTTVEQFRCEDLISLYWLALQILQQPQGRDCKYGDGGHCKTYWLHKTLPLQVVHL